MKENIHRTAETIAMGQQGYSGVACDGAQPSCMGHQSRRDGDDEILIHLQTPGCAAQHHPLATAVTHAEYRMTVGGGNSKLAEPARCFPIAQQRKRWELRGWMSLLRRLSSLPPRPTASG